MNRLLPQLFLPEPERLHVDRMKLLRDSGCSLAIGRLPELNTAALQQLQDKYAQNAHHTPRVSTEDGVSFHQEVHT